MDQIGFTQIVDRRLEIHFVLDCLCSGEKKFTHESNVLLETAVSLVQLSARFAVEDGGNLVVLERVENDLISLAMYRHHSVKWE